MSIPAYRPGRIHCLVLFLLPVVSLASSRYIEPVVERTIPGTGEGIAHVFTEGQTVRVNAPAESAGQAVRWRALDDRGGQVAAGTMHGASTSIALGKLGIGWYRVEFIADNGQCLAWTTAAVLAKLAAPVPQDSPICIDSATAWFAPNDLPKQQRFARLAALAGINWVRDRLRWRDIQPEPQRFEASTTYDTSADIQVRNGLKVLQVFHDTPPWAVEKGETRGRYASDLRHVYRFGKEMARRFKGRVHAWEPWNEANVSNFGGHTADEMCSYQKAAYLGFKAGDPDVIVCWNVSTAVPTRLHTRLVLENETWPYFDTYNTHTYDWPESYERLWGPVIEASCGRPIWVTESDRGMHYVTPEPWCDLSREGEIRKAEFMAQSYASSLFAGAKRHFHFILGHYCEGGKVQFGLLRLDQTPRPSYVAVAALGRFLAGAECLGKWNLDAEPHAHVYAFEAEPDGRRHDVLVAWAEKPGEWSQKGKTTVDWSLPDGIRVERAYDYLGRTLPANPSRLTSAPVYLLLKAGAAGKLPLARPRRAEFRPGKPCPIVLQLHMPRSASVNVKQIPWASDYEHLVEPQKETELPLYVYNFSDERASGRVAAEHLPAGWKLTPDTWDVTLEPMGRAKLDARFIMPKRESDKSSDNWIKLRGDFGPAGKPVLTFRLISYPGEGYEGDMQ